LPLFLIKDFWWLILIAVVLVMVMMMIVSNLRELWDSAP
jgi:hypothetical protein